MEQFADCRFRIADPSELDDDDIMSLVNSGATIADNARLVNFNVAYANDRDN